MFLVDTNIFVYAANEACDEHEKCFDFLEKSRRSRIPWYSTWPVFFEFLRVATHPKVFEKPWKITQAWLFIEAMLASPTFAVLTETATHAEMTRELLQEYPQVRGNQLHDFHTVVYMKEHGVREICTHDSDFYRYRFLQVNDPLAS